MTTRIPHSAFRIPVVLLLLHVGCSKGPPTPYGETEEYRQWRGSLPPIQAAYFGTRIDGSIDFDLGGRACAPDDWIEVWHNGEVVARKFVHVAPGQSPRILRMDRKFLTGPNWIKFFDTPTNRAYSFQVDTRTVNGQAADFVFSPGGAEGFEYRQSGR